MLLLCQSFNAAADAVIAAPSTLGTIPVRSWKEFRDNGVVKQDFDFSCGAASLATVLRYYGKKVTEKEIMEAMSKEDGVASFEDMANVLPKFGFKAQGVALSFDQLTKLRIPVVAYLRPEHDGHFTVIRGVSSTHVWIGDPSWGNRTLSRHHFLEMWETREDAVLKGKVLVIQPIDTVSLNPGSFDTPQPKRTLVQRQF